jgi:two-component system KDP operon response regulator KdpE
MSRAGALPTAPTPFRTGDLVVDLDARTVTLRGATVPLTPKEYDLLATLVLHAGASVSATDLLSHVWGKHTLIEPRRYLRVCMRNLRRKLEPTPDKPRYVLSDGYDGYLIALE